MQVMDIDAEQALLGAIFVNNDALRAVSGIVRPEYFAEPLHGAIFEASADLAAAGRPADPVTLSRKLPATDIGGLTLPAYLARLATSATTIINAPDYAETIRELWALRRIGAIAENARLECTVPQADPRSVIAELLAEIDATRAEIDDRRTKRQSAAACATGMLDYIERVKSGDVEQGATTGLLDLDRTMGGLRAGELIVAAGRPGMGKSALAASVSRQCAAAGNGVGFFSLEMDEKQITARIMADHAYSSQAPLTFKDVLEGKNLSDRQFERLISAAENLKLIPLDLDTSSNLTVSEIGARTRSLADLMKKRGVVLRAIVIDYLKFVRASDRYKGQRVYEVGEITAGLKALAKDMGICVVLLAQLNRQVEARADKRPELADLRESGDIESDADAVLLLFREAYYLADKTDAESQAKFMACENKLEIIVAKNRNGPTRTVEVFCDIAANAVRNLSRS